MSDLMLFGVLRMPYEMAMSGEISRIQFYDRAQQAADRIEHLEAELEELRRSPPSAQRQGEEARDAARYRWLRDQHDEGDKLWFVYGATSLNLDADIDAARSAHPSNAPEGGK